MNTMTPKMVNNRNRDTCLKLDLLKRLHSDTVTLLDHNPNNGLLMYIVQNRVWHQSECKEKHTNCQTQYRQRQHARRLHKVHSQTDNVREQGCLLVLTCCILLSRDCKITSIY